MTENLKAFNQLLSEDEAIRREFGELLENLRASRIEAIIGFAESHGLTLVAEDFVVERDRDVVSDDELEVVTGGFRSSDDDDCGMPVVVENYKEIHW